MSRIAEALARSGDAEPRKDAVPEVDVPWEFDSEAASAEDAPARGQEPLTPWVFDGPPVERPSSAPPAGPSWALAPGEEYAEKLIGSEHLQPAVLAQFRRLGATLHQAQCEKGMHSVMIASALPAEGKTLVASNLALVLSRSYGRRVLLVDGDLRRPSLHTAFGLANTRGLSDWLNDGSTGPLPTVALSPSLTVLVAGTSQADPLRIVVSEGMRRLLKEASEQYDWVILDTPPVGLLPDARMLASMVDACLLVIRASKTPYPAIQNAIETIGRERVMGTVLNRAEGSQVAPYGDAYDSYYTDHGQAPGVPTS